MMINSIQIMNIFLDTSIVNRILQIEEARTDARWEQDRFFLDRLLNGPISKGTMAFLVNPTVMSQINDTPDIELRRKLNNVAKQFRFTEISMSIFPLHFPVRFLSEEQKSEIHNICSRYHCLIRDRKILADAAFGGGIDVLLTTDRDLARKVPLIGKIFVMLPQKLWEFSNREQD
jgi:hypothetical protein